MEEQPAHRERRRDRRKDDARSGGDPVPHVLVGHSADRRPSRRRGLASGMLHHSKEKDEQAREQADVRALRIQNVP